MLRRILGIGVLALTASPAFGQSSAFEAANVQVAAPVMNPNPIMRPAAIRNGIYELRNATMVDLIRTAYSTEADKVVGGPSWLEIERFDVYARVPEGTTVDAARPMLRTLLADRFKLVVKQDTRQANTWVLSQATGGAKLLRAQSAGVAPSCQGQPNDAGVNVACRSMTMQLFLELVPRAANTYFGGAAISITDATGLTGQWDFDLKFTQNRAQLEELGAKGIPLFTALEEQLGLKLEQKTIATTSFLVEAVNRTPTPNVAGIEKLVALPPAPEFVVAEVKPTEPGNTNQRAQVLPTGAINASAMPLKDLMNLAWAYNSPEMIVGPKWIETSRFDIVGRAFSGADAQAVDDEYLRQALRKLLVDRFQIKFHFEERPINAYALVPGGTVKMTKADPNTRTRCYQGVPPGAKDPRQANPARGGVMTCHNATMNYVLDRLRGFAGGYIQAPPVDMSGLTDGYDFTLNWSPIGLFPGGVNGIGGRAGGDGPAGAAPAVPTGAITLPEAIESQLGLKLEMGKRPVRVMVIDAISETPTAN